MLGIHDRGVGAGRALRAGFHYPTRAAITVETESGAHKIPECDMLTGMTPLGAVDPRVDFAFVYDDELDDDFEGAALSTEPDETEAEVDAVTYDTVWSEDEVVGAPRRVVSGIALGALGVLLGIALGAAILLAAAWLLGRATGFVTG